MRDENKLFIMQSESDLTIEAGCKEKEWEYKDEETMNQKEVTGWHWISNGQLLEKKVCLGKNYLNYSPPGERGTKVYSTVEYHKVRDVDAKKQTLSIDLLLTLRWFDQNIRTNFTDKIQRDDDCTVP